MADDAAASRAGEEPVNAHYKACRPVMARTFGEARTVMLLDRLIPLHHAGKTLVLGAPSAWHRDWVIRHLGERLSKILGQPIRIEVSKIARAAEGRHKAKDGVGSDKGDRARQ